MKRILIPLLLGLATFVIVSVSIAAVPVARSLFMVTRPATPRQTLTYNGPEPEVMTRRYAQMGYQVVAACPTHDGQVFVVLVKY